MTQPWEIMKMDLRQLCEILSRSNMIERSYVLLNFPTIAQNNADILLHASTSCTCITAEKSHPVLSFDSALKSTSLMEDFLCMTVLL